MKKLMIGAAISLAMVGGASAADLPAYRPVPAYLPPAWSWTGCYVGANVGIGWGRNDVVDVTTVPAFDTGVDAGTGVVGGGQIGCDYQAGNWVFGAQTMFDWSGIRGSHPYIGGASSPAETLGTNTPWFGTLTGRIGYTATPQALLYLKGGAAWVHNRYTDMDPTVPFWNALEATRLGWTVGGGAEYSFQPNWSLFVEYAYYDFGNFNATLNGSGTPYTYNEKQTMQTVLFGLNFRFGGPRY
jgi:outer membrane immunogenic protein